MFIEVGPHVVFDALREISPRGLTEVSEGGFQDPDHTVDARQEHELVPLVGHPKGRRKERTLAPYNQVHDRADENLGRNIHHLAEGRVDGRKDNPGSVPLGELPKSRQPGGGWRRNHINISLHPLYYSNAQICRTTSNGCD